MTKFYPPYHATGRYPSDPNRYPIRPNRYGGRNRYPVRAVPPGAPELWYAAWDIDGDDNYTLANDDPIGTWVNKGSKGVSGDLVQATGTAKPTYKAVAASGKLLDNPAASLDGGDYMTATGFGTLASPNIIACVYLTSNVASTKWVYDGSGSARNQLAISHSLSPNKDAILSNTTVEYSQAAANVYHTHVAKFGASAFARVDGVEVVTGNSGTADLIGFRLGARSDAAGAMSGHIVEVLVYDDATVAAAEIEAYFTARYGAGWPQ